VLETAKKEFGLSVIRPNHICDGVGAMNTAFLATLFGMCNGLQPAEDVQSVNAIMDTVSSKSLAQRLETEKRRRASSGTSSSLCCNTARQQLHPTATASPLAFVSPSDNTGAVAENGETESLVETEEAEPKSQLLINWANRFLKEAGYSTSRYIPTRGTFFTFR
jgi:hypothetical protein